jgi:hypothetical protein
MGRGPRMILGTTIFGRRPHSFSSVKSMPPSCPITTARTVHLPSLARELVAAAARGTSFQSNRRPSETQQSHRGLDRAGRGHLQHSCPTHIRSQRRLTHQMLTHCKPVQVLQQIFAVSRRAEQLRLRGRSASSPLNRRLGAASGDGRPRVSRRCPQARTSVQADVMA